MKNKTKIKSRNVTQRTSLDAPDFGLVLITGFMLIFGLVMIFSASAVLANSRYEDVFYFFKRQIIWIIIGSILGFLVYKVPIFRIKKYSRTILIIGIFLLAYLIPEAIFKVEFPFVKTLNGATRWIDFSFFDLQPAEFIKLALIIFISAWFTISDNTKKSIEKFIKRFEKNTFQHLVLNIVYSFLPFFVLGLIAVLILAERDLDTIVIIGLTFFAIYFAAGNRKKHTLLTILTLIFSVIFGILAMLMESYRKSRLETFLQILFNGEPSELAKRAESFQVWNGLVAIGSGGLFGLGYNESRQKLFFLNEAAYTDSIFAVIAEEFGLVGAMIVVLAFLIFISRGLRIAKNASDKFSALLAIGLTSWIGIQAFLNIAANLSIIPFGGMPLPFFTYGGSNTIMILVGVGLLMNISRNQSSENSKLPLRRQVKPRTKL
jgi:cell division protein FtsW